MPEKENLEKENLENKNRDREIQETLSDLRKESFRSFSWNGEEQEIVNFIHKTADDLIYSQFAQIFVVLDNIKEVVREKERVEKDGTVVWKRDGSGGYIEDYTKMMPHHIDNALMTLAMLGIYVGQEVNVAYIEAVLAKDVYEDTFDDAWRSIIGGTQGDKGAKARVTSRKQKYFFAFKAYHYFKVKELRQSLKGFVDTLRFVRDQQQRDRSWALSNRPSLVIAKASEAG